MITCGDSPIMKDVVAQVKKISKVEFVMLVDSEEIKFDHGADLVARVPRGSHHDFLAVVANLVKEFRIDHIFVGSDEEALSLSYDNDIRIKAHIDTPLNIQKILNKSNLYESIENASPDLKLIPSFKILNDRKDLEDMLEEFGSAIIRPVMGRGSRGLIHIVDDKLTDNFELGVKISDYILPKSSKKFFITEYLSGDKYSVDCIFKKGQLLTCMIRNNGPLVKYKPPTMIAKTSIDPDVHDFAIKVGSVLNLSGFHQIECAKNDEQHVKLIEINPRIDATLPITACYDENFYELIMSEAIKGLLVPKFSIFKRFLTSYTM